LLVASAPGVIAVFAGGPTATQTVGEKDQLLDEARGQYGESVRLYRSDAYEKAQSLGERALETRERLLGPDHQDVAASLNAVGRIYAARGDYERADTLYRRALTIVEKTSGPDHLAVAEVLDDLATNCTAKGAYEDAERLGKRALAIREQQLGADHPLVAASLGTLADVYVTKGDFRASQILAERALEMAGKTYGPNDLAYAEFLTRAGRADAVLGSYPRAEQRLSQALEIRERLAGPDSLPAADLFHVLGFVSLNKSDNVKSEQLHLHALAIRERILGPDHPKVGLILNNLGLLSNRRNDYGSAEAFFTRALAINEKTVGLGHPSNARLLNNLGLVQWKRRDYPRAADSYRRALEIAEKSSGPESRNVAPALTNLGIVYKETGDYDRAEAYYKRALAIDEQVYGKQHAETRVAIESLGILYRDKGDYANAEPMFLRALEVTQGALGPDHPDVARHLRNLAHLESAKGDAANALKYFQRASAIEEKNLPLNLAVGSERQKLAYFEPFTATLEKIISFHVRQHADAGEARDLAATTLLQRKGRVLDAMADSLGALRRRSNAEDLGLLDQLDTATSQLATLVLSGPQRVSLAEHQERIKTLTEQRDALEIQINRRSAGYYERTDAVTLAAIKGAVPANAALVEFAIYRPYDPKTALESTNSFDEPRYVAYVIRSQGEVRWTDLGRAADIDEAVNAFRMALRDPKRGDVSRLARALDQKVTQPVRALTGEATHLLVSPEGQLDLIPFEALVDEDGRYLIERYAISYVSAGRDLLRMNVGRNSKSAPLVVANPVFGEPAVATTEEANQPNVNRASRRTARRSVTTGPDLSKVYFAALPGTLQEARTIQSLFPDARVLTGAQASEAALKQFDAPRILHIATHGFFLEAGTIANPLLRSGLALSGANLNPAGNQDGILTALEASGLNLWGTKLVTLSACDTGVGEVRNGEGVYGLRRAFFLAGAETLVMSLWPVSDYVTREMMAAYYGGLRKGLGRGDALRQAQLTMLTRTNRQHPFYWASFIQAGEWANLDGQR
jgi:CHAT domain-containing protein/Tfp pilus assembly protein PilF